MSLEKMGQAAREAAYQLATISTAQKNRALAAIADELEARGWVCRQGVAEDRRCHLLKLTEQGQVFLTDMLPRQRNRLREIWQPFSREEREQFMRLLRKVLEVMPE